MALSDKGRRRPLLLSAAGRAALGGAAIAQDGGTFADEVAVGRTSYAQNCAACHGSDMTNGEFAPPLKGPGFLGKWGGQPLSKLYDYIHASMPPGNHDSFTDATYLSIASLIL